MILYPLERNEIRGNTLKNTFGPVRKNKDGSVRNHQGWDLAAKVGTFGFASAPGKVIWVRDEGDYGLQMLCSLGLKHEGKDLFIFYAHLSECLRKAGDAIEEGEPVFRTGNSGNAKNTKDHLHFELRTTDKERAGRGLDNRVSPLVLLRCPLHFAVDQRGNKIL